ncbi:UBP-type zinc finger domain-containing protein [Sphaerisporangium corydalis]|uniref:UBP-type zinc finger domain-containing protein n=1 Tax=Sphaerisporangium corydalis TaxID=1441875 RepID=UPI0036D375AA
MAQCSHVAQIRQVVATSEGCQECLALGQRWVHLRECLSCGHVGCCDSSRGRHATKHHRATGHPVAGSAEPGESWAWCYLDEEVIDQ